MRRDGLTRLTCGWLARGGIAAAGCSSMGAGSIGGETYSGNHVRPCWSHSVL